MFEIDLNSLKAGQGLAFINGSHEHTLMKAFANESESLLKSYLTGEGIIPGFGTPQVGTPAGTGPDAQNLRVQFLHGVLEQVSFEQEDAIGMKLIPKEKVWSNTFEWTQFQQYGGAGDGFISESGFANQFSGTSVNESDDNFIRQVLQVKYMVATRTVSLPITLVRNVDNPEAAAERGATLELIMKANLALYFGDSKKSITQFNGIIRQIVDYLINNNANDYAILYDAGGNPIDKNILEDIAVINRQKFGKGDLLIESSTAYGDTQKLLFPNARYEEGTATGAMGVNKREFVTPYGRFKLADDPMLRINQPLVVEGTGMDGRPRSSSTSDTGSPVLANDFILHSGPTFGSTVTNATGVAAGTAGTAAFYLNIPTSSGGNVAAVPNYPTGDGNQGNRLAAGSYYYAASAVFGGKESQAFYFGAASGAQASATSVTVTANQVVSIALDPTKVTVGGNSITSANFNLLKFRIYRSVDNVTYNFLCDAGCASASTVSVIFDNGMYIAGTDNSFLITTQKNGAKGWFLAQLLPLMRRKGLPAFVMGDVLAMLMFVAPVLLVPRHHIWIRNVGRPT